MASKDQIMPAKKSKRSTKTKSKPQPQDAFAKAALKFIDQAAGLLKEGVIAGSSKSAKARKVLSKKALSLVSVATERLSTAVQEGSATLRKKLNKL
jgi:hypothetical protein